MLSILQCLPTWYIPDDKGEREKNYNYAQTQQWQPISYLISPFTSSLRGTSGYNVSYFKAAMAVNTVTFE